MNKSQLSIIIPAKNEAKRISKTLDELADYLKAHDLADAEVLVVTGKSTDDTAGSAKSKAAKFQNFQVLEENTPGKGQAVKIGMLKSSGKYRLFMDADL